MVNSNFTPQNKKPGDLILSADWNAAMGEIRRLETAKVNREGADTLKGPLTIQEALNVAGDVKISGNRLKSADGWGILETNKKDWLRINPDGNYPGIALYKSVAIGSGGLAIGEWEQQPQGVLKVTQSAYLATAGGNVGVGTTGPKDKLHVVGNLVLGLNEANKKFIFHPRTNANGDFLQITFDKTDGNWNWDQGITLKRGGDVGIGTQTPSAKLQVSGTIQATDNNQTLVGLIVNPTFNNNQKTDVKHLGLQVNGALATTQVETKEVVRLVRGATSNVKNSNSVSLNVGAFESGIKGKSRLDIALAGTPGDSNSWGFVPDVTVMSLRADGRVGIGTIDPQFTLDVNGSVRLGGFTSNDADEWPKIAWCRDTASKWDEGLIKHAASRGIFKKGGYGVHLHHDREFGLWSTDWNPLFAVEGGSGNAYLKGELTVKGNIKATRAIQPSAGNTETAGIMFPKDPGGGSGDAAWIRYYARSGESCTLEIGISNDADDHIALMPNAGNVGIGTTTPSAKLDVNGLIRYSGGFVAISDISIKQDIENLSYGLQEILQLRPVTYNWKHIPNYHKSIGLIAQEVEPLIKEVVYESNDPDGKKLSIAYTNLIPVLIKAIQELNVELEKLKNS